eukprot:XP_011432703.1 PREDICTED: placenta-specific gene 8 protein [Crassostrea gigas]
MEGGQGFGYWNVGQAPETGPQPVIQQPQQPPPGAYHYQPPGYPQPVHHQQQTNTTVVINQGRVGRPPPRDWSSGICGCFEDMSSCCGVYWCGNGCYPCYLSSKLNESCCLPFCLPGFPWLIALRVKMRAENNIQGSIMNDCCCVCCCSHCVMCQLSREHDYTLANPQTY